MGIGHHLPIAGPAIESITDVTEKQLCLGCGACAFAEPDHVDMVDVPELGRRPLVRPGSDGARAAERALAVCPGASLTQTASRTDLRWSTAMFDAWGPVLEIWEGHASDEEVRFAASSGGAATALALHGLTRGGMHGVLHITARSDIPYLNTTVLSRSRDELLAATGSRYAPASPCERLDLIEQATGPCVFIGKPCDVAALEKACRQRPALDRKVGLTIAIFCAGTPSTKGTLEMIRAMGIDRPDAVRSLRYRGRGWPGVAQVQAAVGDEVVTRTLSYEESWGDILQRHRPWRCHVCADHTGEFADISVGDPWYREIPDDEPGRSLVIARTERGRRFLAEARSSSALAIEPVDDSVVARSQPNLLTTRGAVWGRIVTSRLLGVAAPKFRRMPIFRIWWHNLTPKQKLQSIYGTTKRMFTRGLYRRTIIDRDSGRTAI